MCSSDGHWSIVLAGGEGERTRAFVESWLGYHRAKQYCAFTGTRSLFQHTVDRADALSRPERRVVVAAQSHRDVVFEQLRGRGDGILLFQPENRGTGAGVFLALTSIVARDPTASVVIYPSDHFIYPESAFLNTVGTAVRHTERCADELVLLGVRPGSPELDYGWIVPSPAVEDPAVRRVEAFLEKPPRRLAEKALEKGGLWNTMILAGKVDSFLALGWRCVPEIMRSFARFGESLRPGRAHAPLEDIYQNISLARPFLPRSPESSRPVESPRYDRHLVGRLGSTREDPRDAAGIGTVRRVSQSPRARARGDARPRKVTETTGDEPCSVDPHCSGSPLAPSRPCAAPERSASGIRLAEGDMEPGQAALP